jgi:hypothetical protein
MTGADRCHGLPGQAGDVDQIRPCSDRVPGFGRVANGREQGGLPAAGA